MNKLPIRICCILKMCEQVSINSQLDKLQSIDKL